MIVRFGIEIAKVWRKRLANGDFDLGGCSDGAGDTFSRFIATAWIVWLWPIIVGLSAISLTTAYYQRKFARRRQGSNGLTCLHGSKGIKWKGFHFEVDELAAVSVE